MRRCLLVLCIAAGVAAEGAGVSFQRLDFEGGAAHGIFADDLDGDGSRDLIAFGRGRIAVYRGSRAARPQYSKDPEVLFTRAMAYFADIADVHPAKGKEVVILTPSGVAAFVHEGGRYARRPVELLRCDTLLTARPVRGAVGVRSVFQDTRVKPWNFGFDANGDGRDDLLVPHGDGTDVYLQGKGGKFGRPTTLLLFPAAFHDTKSEVKPGDLGGHETPNVSIELILRQIKRRDVDGDGRPDLVCGTCYFAQKKSGVFDPAPIVLPARAARRLPRFFRDVNADGRVDKIAEENTFDDPLNIVTRVRLFLAGDDGVIPDVPTQTIVSQNILVYTPLPVHDFNNDGALDFAMFKTDITLTEVAKWIRQNFGKIDGDLRIWYFDRANNRYNRRASYEKTISMRFRVDLMDAMQGLVWDRYLRTMMRFGGDYNADGRVDLLVREKTDVIAIYFNTGDPRRLFPRRPDVRLEEVPLLGGMAVHDLNGDGASDVILYAAFDPMQRQAPSGEVIAAYISQLR